MKLTAAFEEGHLSVTLHPETDSEKRMLGAVIEQPQAVDSCAYMDKNLISASCAYDGHWSSKMLSRVTLNIYRPNKEGS